MKTFFFVALVVAGTYGQLDADQQLILQQQQLFSNPALLQQQQLFSNPALLQQQYLYPGLSQFGGLGLQGYNSYLNNPFLLSNPLLYSSLTKSPYSPLFAPTTVAQPAIQEIVKEVDIVRPTGLSGVVELDGLDAYLQDAKNKNQGHTETYHWQRSGLPKLGRSSLNINRYPQQAELVEALLKNSGKRPEVWPNVFKNERSKAPFTVKNPPHAEIYTYH